MLNGISVDDLQKMIKVSTGPNGTELFVDPKLIGADGRADPRFLSSPTTPGEHGQRIWLYGPRFWNVDLGLQRNFKLGAERRLELRFDAYNVFNHINRDLPSNAFVNIQDARAGEITGIAGYTRTMQVGLRVAY